MRPTARLIHQRTRLAFSGMAKLALMLGLSAALWFLLIRGCSIAIGAP